MNPSLTASCLTRLLLPWQTLAHVSHEALSGAPPGSPPGFLRAAPTHPCSDSLGALWLSPPHGWDTVVPCVSTALSPLRVGTDLGSCPCPQLSACHRCPEHAQTVTAWVNEAMRSRNLFLFTVSLRPKPFSPEVRVAEVSPLWDGGAADVNDGDLLPTWATAVEKGRWPGASGCPRSSRIGSNGGGSFHTLGWE